MKIEIRRLPSGYYHIRGEGPCNWSQPPVLTEGAIRTAAHPEASEEFLQAADREVEAMFWREVENG